MKNILVAFVAAFCFLLTAVSKAQTAAVDNKPSHSITFQPIPKGKAVFGVFEGRPPCNEIARQLQMSIDADCTKLKWRLTLYRDTATLLPTGCTALIVGGGDIIKQEGSSYRQKIYEGQWKIIKGLKSDPAAEIYQLDLGGTYFYFLKGDENVLFVLDENKEFRVGNEDFSYTLNRVELVPGKK